MKLLDKHIGCVTENSVREIIKPFNAIVLRQTPMLRLSLPQNFRDYFYSWA